MSRFTVEPIIAGVILIAVVAMFVSCPPWRTPPLYGGGGIGDQGPRP